MIIADTNGTWVRSSAQYPLQDPESGTRFEPGTIYKAKMTEWLKGQPAIAEIPDPLAPAEAVELPVVPPVVPPVVVPHAPATKPATPSK